MKIEPSYFQTKGEVLPECLRFGYAETKMDTSRRCAERVKKAMEVAKTAREELEATVKAKREMLDKQLRDAEIRRQKYLEVGA
jgi:hypothetical protein